MGPTKYPISLAYPEGAEGTFAPPPPKKRERERGREKEKKERERGRKKRERGGVIYLSSLIVEKL